MSQIYSTEPQTTGRVILETTHGPLEVNLWSRECPSATRLFLQHCMDGFYENVLFHRVVPNFLIQTGALRLDPTTNAHTSLTDANPADVRAYRTRLQADEALDRRQYELNSRIRFNHRGQVAMAMGVDETGGAGSKVTLQPQFFITLDEASELDGKHVCFGTVAGPTVFNALRIGRTDVDEDTHQPRDLAEAPRIQRVKIVENPLHSDLVPTPVVPWKTLHKDEEEKEKKKKKRKGVRNINVLSFGDDMEEDEEFGGGGIKSSHEMIKSKKFSSKVDKKLEEIITSSADPASSAHPLTPKESSEYKTTSKSPILNDTELAGKKDEPTRKSATTTIADVESQGTHAPDQNGKDFSVQTRIAKPKQEMKSKERQPKLSLVEARRAKYLKRGSKSKHQREEDTMAKFRAFQSKVSSRATTSSETQNDEDIASRMMTQANKKTDTTADEDPKDTVAYHGQILEDTTEVEGDDWLQTRFKCRKHQDHEARLGGDGRSAIDDYKVIDERYGNEKDRKRHKPHHERSKH